jgi:hypothetical protein
MNSRCRVFEVNLIQLFAVDFDRHCAIGVCDE